MRPPPRPLGPASALCVSLGLLGGTMANAEASAGRGAPAVVLRVDASEAPRKIFHAKITIPARPGPLTLLYPKWIPGTHSPSGPIADLAGLHLRAGGRPLAWRRDDVDMFAFHCDVPAGCDAVDASYDYLVSPGKPGDGAEETAAATPRLAVINWNQLVLYPEGTPARGIACRAELRLPRGWAFGTALPVESAEGPEVAFATVSLETLIDSPVLCGAHFKTVAIGPDKPPRHFLHLACDGEEGLRLEPETKDHIDRLVAEAGALFGGRHYGSYHFLLALSDHLPETGVEHLESSDIRLPERALVDDKASRSLVELLAHEYVHSWNGKHRRPRDMVADNYQRPLRTRLVWVYEGLTQYLGAVLTARCGLWSADDFREYVAAVGDRQQNQRGRAWRPLEDTAVGAQLLYGARPDWSAWRRGLDFYDEGFLIWLEVDALIRERTAGKRSLDDLCRRLFGGDAKPAAPGTYTLEELLAELEATAPHAWKTLLAERVSSLAADAPLGGIRLAGWRLGYGDAPSNLLQSIEHNEKTIDLTASIGLKVDEDGEVLDVIPGKAADRAGVGPGMKLIAANSRRFSAQLLRSAVAATGPDRPPLELLVENDEFFRTHTLDYRAGARYPRLERDPARADVLSKIIAPLADPGPPAEGADP